MPLLLNQIVKSSESDDLKSQNFISKLLFSLSGLLRNFPIAQNKFIQYGGVETLSKVLNNSAYSSKLKAKTLTVVNDMIVERVTYFIY